MEEFGKYQQRDTLQLKGLLDIQNLQPAPIKLKVDRIPISERNLRPLDSIAKERVVVEEKPKPPTRAQIRYWLRKQEESLLVGSSRTMKPIDAKLLTTEIGTVNDIVLPVRAYKKTSFDWLTILLLLALMIFASIKIPYRKYLAHLFQSLVNFSTATRMFREREISLVHGSFRLEVYFYITFSVFVYFVLAHFGTRIPLQSFNLYLFSLGITLGYFVVKRMIYMVIGNIVEGTSETMEYLYNLTNYNRVLGLFLFPVIAFVLFSPIFSQKFFIHIGLVLVGIFYFLSLQRGILILIKKQFSIYYLFLYLCTLEILPLLLIYKLVIG